MKPFGRIIGRAAMALGSIMLLGGPVSAQETGTLIKHKAAQIDEIRTKGGARLVAEQFGACVVDRSELRSLKWVDLPFGSPEFRNMRGSLTSFTDECISGGELTISDVTLRGAMLQSLYLRYYSKKPVPVFAPDANSGYRSVYPEELSPEARQIVALEQFGECVAKADPETVRRLLTAVSESGGEAAIFAELGPRFSGCIVQGENLKFSKLVLKSALAEGMFRLTRATQTATASK